MRYVILIGSPILCRLIFLGTGSIFALILIGDICMIFVLRKRMENTSATFPAYFCSSFFILLSQILFIGIQPNGTIMTFQLPQLTGFTLRDIFSCLIVAKEVVEKMSEKIIDLTLLFSISNVYLAFYNPFFNNKQLFLFASSSCTM